MKTLGDIIEMAKSGGKPSHDECYWALLAVEALSVLDSKALRRTDPDSPEYF